MTFVPARPRLGRPSGEPRVVLAVGQRAFVHCPVDPSRPVFLTDEHGAAATTGLRDGTEVEVLAWRPRGSAGTRYRVCNRSAGTDGWLAAQELRTTAIRPVAEPAPASAPHPDATRRPFGSTTRGDR